MDKQYKMLKVILGFYNEGMRALKAGVYLNKVLELEIRDRIARSKYIEEANINKIDEIYTELVAIVDELIANGGIK